MPQQAYEHLYKNSNRKAEGYRQTVRFLYIRGLFFDGLRRHSVPHRPNEAKRLL